jgi:hypothetical protein
MGALARCWLTAFHASCAGLTPLVLALRGVRRPVAEREPEACVPVARRTVGIAAYFNSNVGGLHGRALSKGFTVPAYGVVVE